ncbi:MAG TPA: carboxypeptidase regulatory-like domain-containing protein [Candidatus Limnocylindrales bacterium]|nr:carboxypeptidase regulatory-like domain-containing protein [Candidatus Limnocylindrales bacterium]
MLLRNELRFFVLLLVFAWTCGGLVIAQTGSPGAVQLTVTDQNGQPLPAVIVLIEQNGKTIFQGRTTPSGNAGFQHIAPGDYKVIVQKQGFYTATVDKVQVQEGATVPIEVRLQPVREFREEVEVTAQPSPIDPEQTVSSQDLTAVDISNIPYPTTRDYRNVLPYIPGVLADSSGQIHVAGASTQQIQDYLDGFEVSQPAGGALAVRLNPDSLRKIDVRNSRYSALFGKGSGGLTDLEVQDGDNHFRFNATDFIPTFQNVKGLRLNNWTPRAYFSGPLVRDKVWFGVSHEGENDLNIIKELPDGADTNAVWRTADLARLRMNLTPGNVLTASALVNLLDSEHSGISAFDPVSVSSNVHTSLYLLTLKDQITIARSTLLEFGAGFHRNKIASLPMGNADYLQTPSGREGNFFLTSRNISSRAQGFTNLYLSPWKWLGTHQFTVGGRLDRVLFHGQNSRTSIDFLDATPGTPVLLRQITFVNAPPFSLSTLEGSAFLQDRWSIRQRVIIEPGARWDHDSFLQRDFYSPRIAGTALLSRKSETKLSAGIGVYFDRTNLALVSEAFQGVRTDTFVVPVARTTQTQFLVNAAQLTMPRFVNWSAGIERRLPAQIYARLEVLSRHGSNVWAFEQQPDGSYILGTNKQDKYDAAQITLRKEFKRGYPIMVAYTRSRARSNESLGFSLDNFTTGNQFAGPLQWDAPNQVTSWGSFPLPSLWKLGRLDFAYSLLWHTGYPFITVDQFGQLVSGTAAHRFPDFFTFSPAIEKKFNFHGYRWAARVGLENVTNSLNPNVVDNNVDSPTFLTFFGSSHRTLNGRIRFLGKQ